MGYIENEFAFREYMINSGELSPKVRINYISWLKFLSNSNFRIDRNLDTNENIITALHQNENNRDVYKSDHDYSNLGSVLNKYRAFLNLDNEILINDINDISNANNVEDTERKSLIKARIGQGKYRRDVVNLWGKCAISELKKTEFLIASHILPWKLSNNIERLNPYNGLLLLPNYDKMFNKGYISFNNDGTIILSNKVNETEFEKLGIKKSDRLYKIEVGILPFLERHREIFSEILY